MKKETSAEAVHAATPGSLRSYVIGFGLSLVLTFAAYFIAQQHVEALHQAFSHQFLTVAILVLAVAQLIVQLVFFLHVSHGPNARWNIMILLFMILVVLIVVIGSLWIMSNLNYNMMTPEQTDAHMKYQGQKGF